MQFKDILKRRIPLNLTILALGHCMTAVRVTNLNNFPCLFISNDQVPYMVIEHDASNEKSGLPCLAYCR